MVQFHSSFRYIQSSHHSALLSMLLSCCCCFCCFSFLYIIVGSDRCYHTYPYISFPYTGFCPLHWGHRDHLIVKPVGFFSFLILLLLSGPWHWSWLAAHLWKSYSVSSSIPSHHHPQINPLPWLPYFYSLSPGAQCPDLPLCCHPSVQAFIVPACLSLAKTCPWPHETSRLKTGMMHVCP